MCLSLIEAQEVDIFDDGYVGNSRESLHTRAKV